MGIPRFTVKVGGTHSTAHSFGISVLDLYLPTRTGILNIVTAGARARGRGILAGLVVVAAVIAAGVACTAKTPGAAPAVQGAHRISGGGWVTSWSASPQAGVPGKRALAQSGDRTVRDVVFASSGGTAVRLVLSNAFGTAALRVGGVTVAVAGRGAAVLPGTIRQVRFGASASVAIPPGGQALSDPVALRVPALHDLAVSLYLPDPVRAVTMHRDAQQVSFVSRAGDHAGDVGGGAFNATTGAWYYLSGVVLWSPPRVAGTVVAFGDSITDGLHSAVDGNGRWPNDLARRLAALGGRTLAVVDAGISGNRLLTGDKCCGVSGLARFQRDALGQPGVRDVIALEGINDFGYSLRPPSPLTAPGTAVSAAQVIAGYERLIALAHARGVRIFGATLLPFQGAGYYSAGGEAKRAAVNAWIRGSGAFDGVIDFDRALRDPAHPLRLNPAYDCGDHLHPNDAGYQAMANAVSLNMLLAGAGSPAAPKRGAKPVLAVGPASRRMY
jgi:lysophospholipase L1-like esterase